jgi:prophage DNA circulation protein
MALVLLAASFGGVRLDLGSFETKSGRSLVVHELTRGDQAVVQDRGRATPRTSCVILFVEREGVGDSLTRFETFRKLVDSGDPHVFRHPIDGSYLARVEGFDYAVDSEANEITVSCDFIGVGERTSVKAVPPTLSDGLVDVSAATSAARNELAETNSEAPSLDNADTVAESWSDSESVSPRQVTLELQTAVSRLQYDAEELRLSSDIERWQSFKHFVYVQAALRSAAKFATSSTAETFEVTVREPTPLRSLVASIYGARMAESRLSDVLALNDLATPNSIPAGTVVIMPVAQSGAL